MRTIFLLRKRTLLAMEYVLKRGDHFEDQLRSSLEASGWRIQAVQARPDLGFDFIAEKGTQRYAIEVKSAKESRRPSSKVASRPPSCGPVLQRRP